MVIKKSISYGLIFMLGFYLGSGGCLDRMLGQKQSKIEEITEKNSMEYNSYGQNERNDYGTRDNYRH